MTFEEACLYCILIYHTAFSYQGSAEENFFVCPWCGEAIYEDSQCDFSECSFCGCKFVEE